MPERKVRASSLVPPPRGARHRIGETRDLAESIERHGLLQPPVVRKQNGRAEIIVGQRRAQVLARSNRMVSVTEVEASDAEALGMRLSEEFTRSEMDTPEKVEALVELKALLEAERGNPVRQSELARIVGTSSSTIKRYLGMASLPESVRRKARRRQAGPKKEAGASSESDEEPTISRTALMALGELSDRFTPQQHEFLSDKFARGMIPENTTRAAREALRWALDETVPKQARVSFLRNPGTTYHDGVRLARNIEDAAKSKARLRADPMISLIFRARTQLRIWSSALQDYADLAPYVSKHDRQELLEYTERAVSGLLKFKSALENGGKVARRPTEEVVRALERSNIIDVEVVQPSRQ
jgi:ParB/RepB/Spo0J family partition protein